MPYTIYTYEHVTMGTASIKSALYSLNDSDKQQLLDDIEKWNCSIDNHMFDLIKYSHIHCKMDCKVLMDGCCIFRSWMLEHTDLDVDNYITIQSLASACYA